MKVKDYHFWFWKTEFILLFASIIWGNYNSFNTSLSTTSENICNSITLVTFNSPCQLTCWTCCCCQESCPSQPHPSCSHCIMHHVPVIPIGFVACTCNVSVVLMQSLFLTISIAPLTWFCCHQSSAWHMLSVLVTPWRVNFFIHYLSVRVDHESCGSIQLKGLTYFFLFLYFSLAVPLLDVILPDLFCLYNLS